MTKEERQVRAIDKFLTEIEEAAVYAEGESEETLSEIMNILMWVYSISEGNPYKSVYTYLQVNFSAGEAEEYKRRVKRVLGRISELEYCEKIRKKLEAETERKRRKRKEGLFLLLEGEISGLYGRVYEEAAESLKKGLETLSGEIRGIYKAEGDGGAERDLRGFREGILELENRFFEEIKRGIMMELAGGDQRGVMVTVSEKFAYRKNGKRKRGAVYSLETAVVNEGIREAAETVREVLNERGIRRGYISAVLDEKVCGGVRN